MLNVGVKESNVGGLNKTKGKETAHFKKRKTKEQLKSPLRPIPTVPIMTVSCYYKKARKGLIIYIAP